MKIALIYDFDKTLSITDMQNFDFISKLGLKPEEFWGETGKIIENEKADKILSYMYMMVKACKEKNIKLTHEYLNECGKSIILYDGVKDWFLRINNYAASIGVELEHYIISSGNFEILEGTPIFKYFTKVFGCEFIYENGVAVWPKIAVNYTQKTQFVVRIAKGVLDVTDDDTLNKKTDNLRIEYNNMIYLGDGITDIPCMQLIKERGGFSVAIYQMGKEDKILPLVEDNRVNIACPGDYTDGSKLDKAIKQTIAHMKLLSDMKDNAKLELESILKKR